MSFFENLGATLGNAAGNAIEKGKEFKDVALDKGKEFKDVATLKTQISTAQSNVAKLYKELGEKFFEDNKDADTYPEISAIRDALVSIKELEDKLMIAQGMTKCPTCGAPVEKGSQFCSKCGASVEQ
ncbi:MAG: zinc-ribbon domain-containing protein [Lachnospiraceae bacterium]|nr:zinc-ribbon domain-containing protein [Lachnospiraceae bacterium]